MLPRCAGCAGAVSAVCAVRSSNLAFSCSPLPLPARRPTRWLSTWPMSRRGCCTGGTWTRCCCAASTRSARCGAQQQAVCNRRVRCLRCLVWHAFVLTCASHLLACSLCLPRCRCASWARTCSSLSSPPTASSRRRRPTRTSRVSEGGTAQQGQRSRAAGRLEAPCACALRTCFPHG